MMMPALQAIPLAERLYSEAIGDDASYAQLSQLVAEARFAVVREAAVSKTTKSNVRQFEEIGDV